MRGGQLALESWAIRAIEASPSGVSVVELSGPMGPTVPPGREATQKPVPKKWDRLLGYWKRAKDDRLLDAFLKPGLDRRGEEGERFHLPPLLHIAPAGDLIPSSWIFHAKRPSYDLEYGIKRGLSK